MYYCGLNRTIFNVDESIKIILNFTLLNGVLKMWGHKKKKSEAMQTYILNI